MDNTAGHFLYVIPTLYAHVYIYLLISTARYIMHPKNNLNYKQLKPAVQQIIYHIFIDEEYLCDILQSHDLVFVHCIN